MVHVKRRILSMGLVLVMLVGMLPLLPLQADAAEVASGSCGKNVTWELSSNGTLTINGSGKMDDYSLFNKPPWYSARAAIQNVHINSGVTSIGTAAFYDCMNLTSVDMPNSITDMRSFVFQSCSNLRSVKLSNSITSIGSYEFQGCNSLESITIPDSVTAIYSNAFSGCSRLKTINIPNSVKKIDDSAFLSCDKLSSVYIDSLYNWCNIDFHLGDSNPLYYGAGLYLNGSLIKNLKIPDNITTIKDYTFYGCGSFLTVNIPNSVTEIGDDAFRKCSNLTDVTMGDSVTHMEINIFRDCFSLSRVHLSNSLTFINPQTFYNCKKLTNINIPNSLTGIGSSAFYGCSSLTDIKFPSTMEVINSGAFHGCSNLTKATFLAPSPRIGNVAFKDSGLKFVLFYENAPGSWTVPEKSSSSASFPADVTIYYAPGKAGWTSPTWHGYKAVEGIPNDFDNDNSTENPSNTPVETPSSELKQQYIKEHMDYANSDAFKKEIVPGYGPLLRSILDDVNDNKAVSSYKFLSDVSDMVSFNLKNLNTTEEYELLLAQILFNTESKNAVAKSYEEYLAEEISTLGDLLIDGKTFADSISSDTREKIRSVLASISAADPGSQEFNQKCGRLFDILDGYDDVDLASRFLEKVKGTGGDFLTGFAIDEAKQVCDTMSEYFMYLAAGEAYAKTSDAFGTIILEMRRSLPVSSKNNTLFNPVSKPTIQEKPLLRALGLDKYTGPTLTSSDPHAPIQLAEIARALEKFYTNITDYKNEGAEAIAENALEGFIDGSAEALLDNSIQAAISVFSGLPFVREYEVIKTALSTGKFAVDVLTNVDDQAYLGSTLLRLCALSYILHPTIEKIAGTPADWNTQQVLSPLQKSVSLEDYQFNRAVDFDESINIYKSILSVASDYGESYARACLTAANKSILNLNKSETVSWYSTAISAARAQEAACKEIHCHTPGLEYDPNTNRVTYKSANLKVYTVACPVDVTVKTDTGKQIAFLSNRGNTIAEGYEQYFYTVESKETAGDYIKVAVVPASYKVTLQGSGSGTMNAYVAEVNDGTLQHSGGFYDIPVTRSTEGQFVSGKTVSEDDLILNGKTIDIVPDMPFKDVKPANWFYNDVKYVYEKGMMAGTAADVFAPNATTTRAMIVTILYRLEGSPAVTGTSAFVDVPAGQWYTDAVNWAAANQIVKGTSATTFAPNASITREQMAAILYRYAQYKGYDVTKKADLSGYSDNSQVSSYAKDALAWANAAKLINGVTNTTLAPQGNATRAQVSAILHRFCDGVVK